MPSKKPRLSTPLKIKMLILSAGCLTLTKIMLESLTKQFKKGEPTKLGAP